MTKDPLDEFQAAVERLGELTTAVAAQREQAEVLDAITRLRLAVVRAYGGRRPRHPNGQGARRLILAYLQENLDDWVYGDELAAVSQIGEWARRVRELRVEDGYDIEESNGQYRLNSASPDRERRDRWRAVGEVQEGPGSPSEKVESLLERLLGVVVNVEELNRVAGSQDGARLVRKLRDEDGWPVETSADAPDLASGEYRLVSLDPRYRLDPSQRVFSEDLRHQIYQRDRFKCWSCGRDHYSARHDGSEPFLLQVRHLDATNVGLLGLSMERLTDLSRLATACHDCSNRSTPQMGP